jgi:ankyrin repeat protein
LAVAGTALAAERATLADAAERRDQAGVRTLLKGGVDVNATQPDGTTALHWAAYHDDADTASLLMKAGANVNAANRYGVPPLALACTNGNAAVVRLLLEAGADANAATRGGETVLMMAARSGSVDAVKALLVRGAKHDSRERRGQTALMWAADGNFPDLAQYLIAHGAEVRVRAAANTWDAQITSEPRAQYRPTGGLTPLLYAARSGCSRCVRAMLEAGADVNQPNPDGVTPLMVAIDNFHYDTARLLLDQGANPHVWDWWGRTALYVAVDMNTYSRRGPQTVASETSALDVIRLLLDAGVNPNPQLNMHRPGRGGNSSRFVDDLLTTGATPLLRAAIGHDAAAVRALLDHGALVDLPNVMGVTPLMGAAGHGVSGRDRRLNIDDDAQTRAIATLEILIAAGADVNARITDINGRTARIARISTMTERDGQTALYGAVKFGWARVVQFLLERGARTDVVDALGKSPLNAALGQTGGRDNTVSQEVAELIRKAGGGA